MPLGPRMQAAAQGNPDAMQAGEEGLLARPDDLDQWIFLGATVGHGPVREGDSRKFSADDPGQILITRMEPGAYRYYRENSRYADGTTCRAEERRVGDEWFSTGRVGRLPYK